MKSNLKRTWKSQSSVWTMLIRTSRTRNLTKRIQRKEIENERWRHFKSNLEELTKSTLSILRSRPPISNASNHAWIFEFDEKVKIDNALLFKRQRREKKLLNYVLLLMWFELDHEFIKSVYFLKCFLLSFIGF